MAKKERHPNYDTPEASLTWGYKCTSKALSSLREQDIKNARKAIYDVRESIRDALFLLKNPKKTTARKTIIAERKELITNER